MLLYETALTVCTRAGCTKAFAATVFAAPRPFAEIGEMTSWKQ
jgi:hypothetical protein